MESCIVFILQNQVSSSVLLFQGDLTFDVDAKGTKTIHVRRFNFDKYVGKLLNLHNLITSLFHIDSVSTYYPVC